MLKILILLFLTFFVQSAFADDRLPLLFEHNGTIGEPLSGTTLKLAHSSVDVYSSPLLLEKKGKVAKKDKVRVLKTIILLYKYGVAKLKEPLPMGAILKVYVLNKSGELQGITSSMIDDGFPEGFAAFQFPDETLYETLHELTKTNKTVALYRYAGEGYYYLKVGQYYVLTESEHFDIVEQPKTIECYLISSDSGVSGWVPSSQLSSSFE